MGCNYRVRWFSSKGAYLVLLWTLCTFITPYSLSHQYIERTVHLSNTMAWLPSILVVFAVFSAPLSGWLADVKFGNYKVFRIGAVLLFIATVMNCLFLMVQELALWEINHILTCIFVCLSSSFFVIGGCACVVTALPLGLDQMHDASSDSIASYIAWFVCSIYIGSFLSEGFHLFQRNCIDKEMYSSYILIWILFLVICMSIVLASNFLLSPKWLIVEPKSPQSLKTMYCVLKFAAKHKAPLNRSALTYWEKDIPSRIDLGKSKYGGPFTTEQVEDVKTTLRLLAISLPFAVITLSFILIKDLLTNGERISGLNVCINDVFQLLLYSRYWYGLLGCVVHEFLIYPFIRNKLPSILKRIGAASLVAIFTSFICLILKLVIYFSHSSKTTTQWIAQILYSIAFGTLSQFGLTLILEFMCAQSPYNMRGLMLSLTVLFLLSIGCIQSAFNTYVIDKICTQPWCPLVSYSVQLALQSIGFLLFYVVARWYKLRVRDDDYSPQRVIEEVYDRYLTAAAAQSS